MFDSPDKMYENGDDGDDGFIHNHQNVITTNSNLFHNVDISNEQFEENSKVNYDSNNIKVDSDAWPQQQEAQVKSKIHKVIRQKLDQIDPKKIYFSQLEAKHIKEVKNLHEEWFPLNYPDTFYERIQRNNVIAIGCFIDLDKQNKQVILGTIMAKINNTNEDLMNIYHAKDMNSGGILGWLSSTLTCREYLGAYIMTLGVVDECRRLGLGTMLLNEVIKVINHNWMNCEVIYLHVVDYNETAIRFYERNQFKTLKRLKNHYVIFEKDYDGLLLYKDIKVNPPPEIPESPRSSADNERNMISPRMQKNTPTTDQSGILSYLSYPIKYLYSVFQQTSY